MFMVLCMYVARTCRAYIIGLLGVGGVLYVTHLVFVKATSGDGEHQNALYQCWERKRVISI